MNYLFLKNILEVLLANFTCTQCGSHVQEQSIFLHRVTANHVDLEVHCPKCQTKSSLRAEMNKMADSFFASPQWRDFLQTFARDGKISEIPGSNPVAGAISDDDISQFEAWLETKRTIKDLMDDV